MYSYKNIAELIINKKIIPLYIYGKRLRWGRIPSNRQKFPHFLHQKSPS